LNKVTDNCRQAQSYLRTVEHIRRDWTGRHVFFSGQRTLWSSFGQSQSVGERCFKNTITRLFARNAAFGDLIALCRRRSLKNRSEHCLFPASQCLPLCLWRQRDVCLLTWNYRRTGRVWMGATWKLAFGDRLLGRQLLLVRNRNVITDAVTEQAAADMQRMVNLE